MFVDCTFIDNSRSNMVKYSTRQPNNLGSTVLVLVEATGVEPVSENKFIQASPGAVSV